MADLARRPKTPAALKRGRQQDRGPRTEYLAFTLGGDVYAAPVAVIREILKPPPLTPVPRAPHHIVGIVSVRGQLVTVVDLHRRLNLPEYAPTRKARILLIDATGGEVMGVMVDEVLQVYRLAESEIEPAAVALGGEVASYLSGIARPAIAAALASTTVRAAGREAPVVAGGGGGGGGAIPRAGTSSLPSVRDEGSHVPDASVVILLDLRAVLAS
jgi:purine-binding chemotaxis protein CheW